MARLQLDYDQEQLFDPDDAVLEGFLRARYAEVSDSPTYHTSDFRRRVLERLRAGAPLTMENLERVIDDVSDEFLALESNVLPPRGGMTTVGAAAALGPRADSVARASRVFATVLAFVPRRIAEEEIGDALEVISALGFTGWQLWAKVTSTIVWVLVNAVRDGVSAILGKRKGGS